MPKRAIAFFSSTPLFIPFRCVCNHIRARLETEIALSMKIDHRSIPYYLVLRGGGSPYVLNADRLVIRREASPLLRAFARNQGRFSSIDGAVWNAFSDTEGLSAVERRETRFYALVKGTETEHQLRLLTTL